MLPRPAYPATLAALTDPDHILFGSDFPYLSKKTIDDNASAVFGSKAIASDHAAEAVARGNASRLFPRFQ